MKEIWKDIIEFEEFYEVSNTGKVRNKRTNKVLYARSDGRSKCRLELNSNGRYSRKRTYKLVAEAFIPNPENKPCVTHLDGDKDNNNVDNLMWCTQKEATQYAHKMGYVKKSIGVNHHKSKLTEQDVREIRKSEDTQQNLAKKYGIAQSMIFKIKKNIAWKHVV